MADMDDFNVESSDSNLSWADVPTPPALESTEPSGLSDSFDAPTKVQPNENAPETPVAEKEPETQAPEPVDKPVDKPAETTVDKPVDKPVMEAPAPKVDDVTTAALIRAAAALGLTERDPAKIPDAIAAHEVAMQQRFEAEERTKAETQIAEQVQTRINEELHVHIENEMLRRGWQIGEGNWWEDKTPIDAENGDMRSAGQVAKAEYDAIRAGIISADPQWRQKYNDGIKSGLTNYDAERARIETIASQYEHAPKDFLEHLRRNGAKADLLDDVARVTHQKVQSVTAMLNSAVTAKDAEIARLTAQISGQAAAIEAARTEGRNAALQDLGKPIPSTVGNGESAPERSWEFDMDEGITSWGDFETVSR